MCLRKKCLVAVKKIPFFRKKRFLSFVSFFFTHQKINHRRGEKTLETFRFFISKRGWRRRREFGRVLLVFVLALLLLRLKLKLLLIIVVVLLVFLLLKVLVLVMMILVILVRDENIFNEQNHHHFHHHHHHHHRRKKGEEDQEKKKIKR